MVIAVLGLAKSDVNFEAGWMFSFITNKMHCHYISLYPETSKMVPSGRLYKANLMHIEMAASAVENALQEPVLRQRNTRREREQHT